MRTVATIFAAAFVLVPWCSASLFAQQVHSSSNGEIKIVITKRSTDADGSEVTETIVKKGKAAENFDAEAYLRENRSDKVAVEVRVENGDSRNVNRTRSRNNNNTSIINEDVWEKKVERLNEVWENKINQISAWGTCNDNSAFLGVEEDGDEDADEEGLVVQVIRGSAAAQAGLKTNDLILSLNDQKVNRWSDLTQFVNSAKSGDKVRIAYRRNGKAATTEATLTTRKEVKSDPNPPKKGFLGVSDADDDPEAAGVRVNITKSSAAEKAGLRNGDVIYQLNDAEISDWEDITDVISESQSGDKLKITYEREGKRNTTEATLGEHKSWDWSNNNQDWQNVNMTTRDKKACLGVYTESDTRGDEQGAEISDFTDESAAQDASMAEGDLILRINGAQVKGQTDLWNEIAKYGPGDKVQVEYLRGTEKRTIEATLKACKDNSTQVIMNETDDDGDNQSRQFFTWNWDDKAQKEMRTSRVITIHRGEGDGAKPATLAPQENLAADRKLQLQSFRASPNPGAQGQITVEFKAEQVPTLVSLLDVNGRQLFREELNAFDGSYSQQFDLLEYAKGTIIIQVQQGDKVYTERVMIAGS